MIGKGASVIVFHIRDDAKLDTVDIAGLQNAQLVCGGRKTVVDMDADGLFCHNETHIETGCGSRAVGIT